MDEMWQDALERIRAEEAEAGRVYRVIHGLEADPLVASLDGGTAGVMEREAEAFDEVRAAFQEFQAVLGDRLVARNRKLEAVADAARKYVENHGASCPACGLRAALDALDALDKEE